MGRRKQKVLQLSGTWSIHHAQERKRELLEALKMCRVQAIDLSGVDWVDTAGLQLILAAVRECGPGVELRGMNADVLNCLTVSGADKLLESWGNRLAKE